MLDWTTSHRVSKTCLKLAEFVITTGRDIRLCFKRIYVRNQGWCESEVYVRVLCVKLRNLKVHVQLRRCCTVNFFMYYSLSRHYYSYGSNSLHFNFRPLYAWRWQHKKSTLNEHSLHLAKPKIFICCVTKLCSKYSAFRL